MATGGQLAYLTNPNSALAIANPGLHFHQLHGLDPAQGHVGQKGLQRGAVAGQSRKARQVSKQAPGTPRPEGHRQRRRSKHPDMLGNQWEHR